MDFGNLFKDVEAGSTECAGNGSGTAFHGKLDGSQLTDIFGSF